MGGATSDAEKRRRTRWPWLLLAGTVGLSAVGGGLASRSISSLLARVEQLEREAAESEARVAELQVLRDSLTRRLRLLEQQQREMAAAVGQRAGEQGPLLARREAVRAELEQLLKAELLKGEAFLEESEGQLRVELADRLFFAPRQAVLTPGGAELLTRVGAKLAGVEGHLVQVAAHTDGVQEAPETAPAPTSWELSAARAVTAARFLGEKVKLSPERLVAAGYGSYHPVVLDDGPLARERNRRLELRLMPAPPPRQPQAPPLPTASKRVTEKKRSGHER
jgi:chemotaxis protein MotB